MSPVQKRSIKDSFTIPLEERSWGAFAEGHRYELLYPEHCQPQHLPCRPESCCGWEVLPAQAERGDNFKPGRLLGNEIKSPWHCIFLDREAPE